jgi:hypothetical protein
MKRLATLLIVTFTLTVGLNSCGKYEDGPDLSLRSKKARLCHVWKVQSVHEVVTVDEVDVTLHWADLVYDIKKDGKYTRFRNNVTSSGKWEFSGDKEQLRFTLDNTNIPEVFNIKRLTKKELWMENEIASKVTKWKLVIK